MKKLLYGLFRVLCYFTEHNLFILYGDEHLKNIAERAKLSYEDDSNAYWKQAYMKARYDTIQKELNREK